MKLLILLLAGALALVAPVSILAAQPGGAADAVAPVGVEPAPAAEPAAGARPEWGELTFVWVHEGRFTPAILEIAPEDGSQPPFVHADTVESGTLVFVIPARTDLWRATLTHPLFGGQATIDLSRCPTREGTLEMRTHWTDSGFGIEVGATECKDG